VLDYNGGRTLDDLIEYVEKRVAGIPEDEDDGTDSEDSEDEGDIDEEEVPKDEL
jgi:hypothetical protein